MTVKITLTLVGADSGPYDLYSNVNYAIPFETNVNKGALQLGYTTALVPDTASVIRVTSVGNCINSIDIPLTSITSSTTSTTTTAGITTTTTSTTAVPMATYHISVAFSDAASACPIGTTFPIQVKSFCLLLGVGCIVYNFFSEVPFAGGGNWYKEQLSGSAFQINGSGVITGVDSC